MPRAFVAALMCTAILYACSDSSGPADTTIVLDLDPVTSPTNEPNPTISGTTDAGAAVTITGPVDTLTDVASAQGTFALIVTLEANTFNELEVVAVDSAGNQAGDTVEIDHDDRPPRVSFVSPLQGATTPGQSGFSIELEFSEDTLGLDFSSGVDETTFWIENDGTIGGVFKRDGTFTTTAGAGTNLASHFDDVSVAGSDWVVPDSLIFPAGGNQMLAHVTDAAGNRSTRRTISFSVTADPDELIPVNASGSAGSSGNPFVVGLANGDTVAGVQFDLAFDTLIIASVDSITVGDRAASFDGVDFNEIQPGHVRVVLFDTGGDTIPPGQGPILTLWLSVDPGAASGMYALTLQAILLSDEGGATRSLPNVNGLFVVP